MVPQPVVGRKPSPEEEEAKYKVLEKIGHGSFGIIHKALRLSDKQLVCRKEISYSKMTEKEREQLSAELSCLRELRHKNIVAYVERIHFSRKQEIHLYMEYCSNGDLGRYIKNLRARNTYASEEFVWTILSQIVTALYRCHRGEDPPPVKLNKLGPGKEPAPTGNSSAFMILHRDLKPENIFLGDDNSAKLGDFGLSKILQTQGFAETYVGTPYYMSPEVSSGEKYTLFSDIWSLGCIIYELCARKPPFDANNHLSLIHKIKAGKFARIPAHYSDDLQDVITKCLQVSPNNRPDTAQLLAMPRIKLVRKEQLIAEWAAKLDARDKKMSDSTDALRAEIETKLRLEFEAKCNTDHLRELERAKQEALQALQNQFETEVQRRVDQLVKVQTAAIRIELEQKYAEQHQTHLGDVSLPSLSAGSQSSISSDPELPQTTSTRGSPARKMARRRQVRTPFSRAHTYAAPEASPMDITMLDPSPAPGAAVTSLNLSPRKNTRSSFVASISLKPAANEPASPAMSVSFESDLESCLEASDTIETPSKPKPRTAFGRAQSATTFSSKMTRPPHAPFGKVKVDLPLGCVVNRSPSIVPVVAASPSRPGSSSNRFHPRRPAPPSPACASKVDTVGFRTKKAPGDENLLKTLAQKKQFQGRTLVELSQEQKAKGGQQQPDKVSKPYDDLTIWDSSKEGIMPSPFVLRCKQTTATTAF